MKGMTNGTIAGLFDGFAESDEAFLLYDDGYRSHSHTYRQTAEAARVFTLQLTDQGLAKGDTVVFYGENRPEWVVAFWGCVLAGVVVVPVDYRASADLLQRICGIAKAKLMLAGDEVTLPDGLKVPVWRFAGVEWTRPTRSLPPPPATRDDTAEILFTSGATAEPKGVIIQHKNILANVIPIHGEMQKYKKYAKPFHPIRFLNLLPLSHMFGQAMATFIPPMLPGVVVFMRGYNPHEIVRQISSRRISVLVCVPKILDVLREYVLREVPECGEAPPPGTHWAKRWWIYRRVHKLFGFKFWAFIVGAAPLPPELEEFWGRLGFVVIQGYGLTETAPIVTLNHPFHTRKGSVGKPIAGVEVKISEDGEILVRGDNVTSGYLNPDAESAKAFEGGWFHTGDIGVMDEAGRLSIRGRKKEMIVTADGLNVFPEDVEGVLNKTSGVRDSAVVGMTHDGRERVHAVLVLADGADVQQVVRTANSQLEDHQRVRAYSVWPSDELPRTEGTRKLKRREIRAWVSGASGGPPKAASQEDVESVIAQYAPGRSISAETTLEELGLSSLERVELLMALERRFGVTIDEGAYAECKSVEDLKRLIADPVVTGAPAASSSHTEPVEFPTWNRSKWAYAIRRVNLPLWLLPLARVFTWVRAEGRENLKGLQGPVIFAPNHQSHLDIPALMHGLPREWRYRIAPAMSKEFFDAHFHPERHSFGERFTNGLNYYLSSLVFNAFPFPQREAGARQTLRYAGELVSEGWCIVIFPEGRITDTGEIGRFMPGVGMMASRLNVPVVPVRLIGLDKVLHRTWRMAVPGRVTVKFGAPLRLEGDDYAALAKQVEEAVRAL
jgi:long-chain acyl-CoA synthetase